VSRFRDKVEHNRALWILRYVRDRGPVDMLNTDFVVSYAEAFGAALKWQTLGAPKCRELSAALGNLHWWRWIDRFTSGIGDGYSGMGFPKWIYSYKMNEEGIRRIATLEEVTASPSPPPSDRTLPGA